MPNDLTIYQHVYVDHDRTKAFFIVTDADGTERFRATRTYEAYPLDRIARENVQALKKAIEHELWYDSLTVRCNILGVFRWTREADGKLKPQSIYHPRFEQGPKKFRLSFNQPELEEATG